MMLDLNLLISSKFIEILLFLFVKMFKIMVISYGTTIHIESMCVIHFLTCYCSEQFSVDNCILEAFVCSLEYISRVWQPVVFLYKLGMPHNKLLCFITVTRASDKLATKILIIKQF